MKPCWKAYGLTEEGARLADAALDQMVQIVQNTGSDVARSVLAEAVFRVDVLPSRTAQYQEQYKHDNGDQS